jgi:hypothetical protein
MMLLIFLAGLTAQFRFVSTVTILQQTFAVDTAASSAAEGNRAKGRRGIAGCRLLKSWASAGAFSLLTPNSKLAQY